MTSFKYIVKALQSGKGEWASELKNPLHLSTIHHFSCILG